jgi:DNA helicase HerA-like ATPase
MTRGRQTLGYVVQVDGSFVSVNLEDDVRSHVAGHIEGISSFEQPGDLISIEAGSDTIVARVLTLSFAEPREVHANRDGRSQRPALRQLKGCVIGLLKRKGGELRFMSQTTRLPALGARAMPLSGDELRATLTSSAVDETNKITVGYEARNSFLEVATDMNSLLSRHAAVLGATGQGKTHFIADIIQQLASRPRARIIVFDVNGEYYPAFSYLGDRVRYAAIGDKLGRNAPQQGATLLKIPYYALGRHGLFRLLLPSERTQAPALRFAIEHLAYVAGDGLGARPTNVQGNVLFDDCRNGNAQPAHLALQTIKARQNPAAVWPHMQALACLAAEYYVVKSGRNGYERDAFLYGHIQSLISRISSLIADTRFGAVVDVSGGAPGQAPLNMEGEAARLVERIFGAGTYSDADPLVQIIDLSQLTQDLMPFVLGALLELFAEQLFRRGAGGTHPTLLVLEEAHHYLRQLANDSDTGQHALAYERLAKEGRKFGLSLLVSTQRPAELSSTVLAQCGTWFTFRLTNELDKRSVAAAAEDSAANITEQLSGLARGEAMAFGAAFPLPIRFSRPELPADRRPDSVDPPFAAAWASI